MSSSQFRRGKRRFDDDESTFLKRDRHRRRLPPADFGSETFGLPEGDRWSTWDQSAPTERGPQPHPDWLVTDLAAVDTRDSANIARWFAARGLTGVTPAPADLAGLLLAEARLS